MTGTTEAGGTEQRWASWVFYAVGLVGSGFFLLIGRRAWFGHDEWDLLSKRTIGSFSSLFNSHDGHWCTIPVIVYRVMWSVFGLRHYLPYQALIIAVHFAAAWLIRRVMLRAGVRPWIATATALVLVLFGRGEQDIISAFQITYVGALVFGLVQLLLADHDGPLDRRDWLGLAAGAAALMCSGVAVTMVIIVGIATLIRRGVRVAAVHTVPLGFVYAIWYLTIQSDARTSGTSFTAKVRFIVTTPFHTLGAMSSYWGLPVLLVALLAVGLVVASSRCTWPEWSVRYAAPAALFLGAGIFLVTTSLGRAGPTSAAFRPRYLDIVLAMALPALAVAADAVIGRWRALTIPVFALLLVGIPGNLQWIDTYTANQQSSTAQFRQTILSLPRLKASHDVSRSAEPIEAITIGWLLDGVKSGRIPAPAPISAPEAAIDTLLLSLRSTTPAHSSLTTCRVVDAPITVHLQPNESIRVAKGTIRVAPATGQLADFYPALFPIGTVLSPERSAVTFRVMPHGKPKAIQLCGPA